ncbi:hypothetical protein JTB14_019320 [Gonioctena quinquepunctata]|nr:hypothetical protein JTB14_019320 [Gonioctena quinquepunctata]
MKVTVSIVSGSSIFSLGVDFMLEYNPVDERLESLWRWGAEFLTSGMGLKSSEVNTLKVPDSRRFLKFFKLGNSTFRSWGLHTTRRKKSIFQEHSNVIEFFLLFILIEGAVAVALAVEADAIQ